MAMHGLAEMTLGVPRVDEARSFYAEFGLSESEPGVFATADGGNQLKIVERPYRQLVEFAVSAGDDDDIGRVRAALQVVTTLPWPRTTTAASRSSSRSSASEPG